MNGARFSRRSFVRAIGLTALLSGNGMVHHAYQFETTSRRLSLPELRAPLRVVQLSDLHYGPFVHAESLRAWVKAALAAAPDAIVITGDFVDARLFKRVQPLVEALARLHAPLGGVGQPRPRPP